MDKTKDTNHRKVRLYNAGDLVPVKGLYNNLLDNKKGELLEEGTLFPGLNKKKASKWILVVSLLK